MKKKLLIESLLATILVFVVLYVLFLSIHVSFKPFNYVVKSIKSINLNDLYFSKLENNTADTNIVLINIEDIDRAGIAEVISKVYEAQPKVIGLDVFFSKDHQSAADSILKATIYAASDKLVMAANYEHSGELNPEFWELEGITHGHSGIITNEDKTEVVRKFEPLIHNGHNEIYSFSAEVASVYNHEIFEQLKHRHHEQEMINYQGDGNAFQMIDYLDILTSDKFTMALKDKIVLIGYCGGDSKNPLDHEDHYYTPTVFKISGNRAPDMFGIQIHANIISMIIKGKYINETPHWLVYLLTLLLTFVHVLFFTYFYLNKHLFYHIAAKLIQLISFILILWLVFVLFSKFHLYFPTKYLLISVVLSVDVLYLYEALAVMIYKQFKVKSIFVHDH